MPLPPDTTQRPERSLRGDAATTQSVIVETALRLFASDPTTEMGAVAEAAGVSRATLYRRFPTREVLLTELRRRAADASVQAVRAATTQPTRDHASPGDRLRSAVLALADLALTYQALLLDGIAGDRPIDQHREIRLLLSNLVRAAQRSGEVRRGTVSADWIVSVISAHLTALARSSHRSGRPPLRFHAQLEATLFDGIAAGSSNSLATTGVPSERR